METLQIVCIVSLQKSKWLWLQWIQPLYLMPLFRISLELNFSDNASGVSAWTCLVSDWLAGHMNRHNQPLSWHAAMDMIAVGWGYDCIQFKLSHMLHVAGLNCLGWQYNKRNFTFLFALRDDWTRQLSKKALHQTDISSSQRHTLAFVIAPVYFDFTPQIVWVLVGNIIEKLVKVCQTHARTNSNYTLSHFCAA